MFKQRDLAAVRGIWSPPTLPPPRSHLLPIVNIAPAKGWPDGETPVAAAALVVSAFATGLEHPRWLYVLPNGDVLVAESDAPSRPDDAKGIRGFIMKRIMKKAGSGLPIANRLTLLRDTNGDGVAETKTVFLKGLNSPFGMALVGNALYVANTDSIFRFPYRDGEIAISAPGAIVAAHSSGNTAHGHGSWNRRPAIGYKVIFVPFANGAPSGEPEDVLSGFLDQDGMAMRVVARSA